MLRFYLLEISWCRENNSKMILLLKGKKILEAKVICSFTSGHSVASAGRKEGTGFGVGWGPVADSFKPKPEGVWACL